MMNKIKKNNHLNQDLSKKTTIDGFIKKHDKTL